MFKRKIEKLLNEYYSNPEARILIVKGARQIGKSYIIRSTAKKAFRHYIEVDLKSDFEGDRLFADVKSMKAFYVVLSALFGSDLNTKSDTIVFLDEIQFYPNLITLLKDLKKDDRFRYIASGSLLGITMKHTFIPMGSVDEADMYPMDFEEFLWANGVGEEAIGYLKECFDNLSPIEDAVHERFLSLFKDYLVSGGLPDAVTEYVVHKNVAATRAVQNLIYSYYRDDCSKYDDEHKLKIMRIYEGLISLMTNKVKRVQFNAIENKKGARGNLYQDEFDYLLASGIALGVTASANPKFPLAETSSKNLIKLYYNDVGILTNLLYKNNVLAILNNDIGVNLGSVYETVSAMELQAHGHRLFYFDSKKVGEVDFLLNDYDGLAILPIEIKSGNDQTNFRAIPKLINPEGNYQLPKGYIFGNKNIVESSNGLITLPIYLIMFL